MKRILLSCVLSTLSIVPLQAQEPADIQALMREAVASVSMAPAAVEALIGAQLPLPITSTPPVSIIDARQCAGVSGHARFVAVASPNQPAERLVRTKIPDTVCSGSLANAVTALQLNNGYAVVTLDVSWQPWELQFRIMNAAAPSPNDAALVQSLRSVPGPIASLPTSDIPATLGTKTTPFHAAVYFHDGGATALAAPKEQMLLFDLPASVSAGTFAATFPSDSISNVSIRFPTAFANSMLSSYLRDNRMVAGRIAGNDLVVTDLSLSTPVAGRAVISGRLSAAPGLFFNSTIDLEGSDLQFRGVDLRPNLLNCDEGNPFCRAANDVIRATVQPHVDEVMRNIGGVPLRPFTYATPINLGTAVRANGFVNRAAADPNGLILDAFIVLEGKP